MDALWILLYGYFLTLCAVRTHADCTKPLGMESKWKGTKTYIHDSQITASSSMTTSNKGNGSRLARLNEKRTSIAGWCADPDDHHPFIKVDLLRIHTVTRIDTQGVVSYPAWVTEFKVEYSMDGVAWHEYKEDGKVKIFPGNINSMIPKKSLLKVPITARLIKLVLLKSSDDAFCLRMELYGCEPKEDCQTPVGLEDRRIKDNQITASTHWNEHYAYNARLHNKFSSSNDGVMWGGWCTDKKDTNQYLNIDLGHVRAVSGVATQGYITGSFVKNYKMNYSLDGQEWKMYTQNGVNKIFSGNWDNETVIRNWFARVFARYIRLNPVSWAPRGYICMRVEIYECSPTVGSVPIVSPPGASYKVNRTSSLNITCMIRGQENFAFIWMKNGFAIANTSTQTMQRKVFDNGTTLSTLTLRNIKYHDTGSVISCTAWYPGLSINTSRNVHVFVNAPRPKIKVTVLKSRDVTIAIMDPSPDDTSKYLIRYKINDDENVPWTIIERARPALRTSSKVYIKIKDLKPFTSYVTEVSSLYKDKDTGPYSVPLSFNTDEDVPSGPPRDVLVEPITDDHIIVSWSVPSYNKVNGRIVKYEVAYRSDNKKFKRLFTKQLQKEITGLRKEKNYEIIVRAYTRKGPGPFSKSITYSTRTDVKPKSETTKALERLSKVTVTSQNAVKVTATVQNLTKISDDNFIVDDVHMTATILNKVVSSNLSSAKVGDNLLKTISNVMNVNTETLHKTQKKYNSSATFVKVLEKFIEKGGKFSINTNNVAVHQQKIKTAFTTMRTSFTTKNNKIIINSTTDVTSGTGQSDASAEIHSTTFPGNETTNETVYFVYYKSSKLFAPSFQQVTVCQDGFTATNRRKITRRGPLYTVERVHKSLVTESSPVIASSLRGREVVNLSQPITIRFKLPPEMIEANHTKCVWWDFNAKGGLGDWSTEGCEFKRIINDTIECECNHMTNFAALVDVYGPSSKACGKHEFALSIIAYIGCGLSILGLALTIFTYGFFAKLRKEIAAKILLHLCTALLCVLIVFISGVEQAVKSKLNCQVVAVLMHYFLLVAFMWMFFEAYFMYFAFVKVWNDHGDYILLKCASIAWGLPGVVVTATILVDTENYGGEHYCRLKGLAFFLAFLAPVVSIIIFNTIIFSMIMYKLSVRPPARPADKDRGREGFLQLRRAFGILILVGLTWMFGFFAISDSRLIFTYTFSVLNCFQGFSIFMFYCVTQRNVRDSWMALLRCDLQSLNRKTVFTESYDPKTKTYLQDTGMRPRTRSEPTKNTFSTLQREKFRPRMHTADVKLPVRDKQTCKRETSSDNPNYEHSVADEHGTKYPQYVTVTIEPPPNDNASEEFEMTPIPGSKSGSLRSHKQESRDTVHSNQSTPKLFRMFKMGNSISAFSKAPQVGKNTLKRTASHTPEAPKQYTPVCLRRTQSAMSLGKENRISGDSLITYASTSSESLSTDSQSPRNGETRRLLTLSRLDPDNYGELIISSQRGSVRGIVGHVETSVDTYDDLIDELSDSEKKRSLSLPANAYSYIFDS